MVESRTLRPRPRTNHQCCNHQLSSPVANHGCHQRQVRVTTHCWQIVDHCLSKVIIATVTLVHLSPPTSNSHYSEHCWQFQCLSKSQPLHETLGLGPQRLEHVNLLESHFAGPSVCADLCLDLTIILSFRSLLIINLGYLCLISVSSVLDHHYRPWRIWRTDFAWPCRTHGWWSRDLRLSNRYKPTPNQQNPSLFVICIISTIDQPATTNHH